MTTKRPVSAAPKWLADRTAKLVWASLHQELTAVRFLEATDLNALARYCQYMAEWIEHTRTLRKEGSTYKTSSKHVEDMHRLRPEVRLRERCEVNLKALEDAIGLNPASRFSITQKLLAVTAPPPPQGQLPLGDGEAAGATGELAAARTAWEGLLPSVGKPN